jgi:hypothetical protein
LKQLSHIILLKKRFQLPVDTILAFFADLSTETFQEHNANDSPLPRSQYASIFLNKTVFTELSTVFTENPNTLTGKISENSATITAALNLGAEDLTLMLTAELVPDELSLVNLSTLFRHTVLANALGVSIREWLALLKLVPERPFADTNSTVIFVEEATNVLNSPYTVSETSYILRDDYTAGDGIGPTDAEITPVLDEMRTGLNKITVENTFQSDMVDAKGDNLKKKLALLDLDPAVLTQFMGTLNNTRPYDVVLAQELPGSFTFPNDLRDKIKYDPATQRISFSNVMTLDERTKLLAGLGVTPEIEAAIHALFRAPRSFLRRNFTTYFPHDYTSRLDSLPENVDIPIALRRKVYHDPQATLLHAKGALTNEEKDSLLSNADPVADRDYIIAVNDLFSQPNSLVSGADDLFLAESDVEHLFDSLTDAQGAITPQRRYDYILRKLLPKLLKTLSYQLLVQKLSQSLTLETNVADLLLTSIKFPANDQISMVFRAPLFTTMSLNVGSTRALFEPCFQAYALLWKIALIISRSRLTVVQLKWLLTYRALPGDPTSTWLQLDKLPLARTDRAGPNFTAWTRLLALTKLRDRLPNGETVLDNVFAWARDTTKRKEDVLNFLNEQVLWASENVNFVLGSLGLSYPAAFKDEVALTRIARCIDLAKTSGCKVADAKELAKQDPSDAEARIMVRAVKSKYDQTTWDTVARPLRNILRNGQRDSLVGYLLANQTRTNWKNSNDLFAYYLMDVEMGPCQLTSRIKAAIGSVQLFVQRSLMNLETPHVTANLEVDSHWSEWEWMKSQPIHGANMRVMINPENYMDPILRDNQSPFFKDFQSELQQADLTDGTAEKAFRNYLTKLGEVSQLEVVGIYHDTEADGDGSLRVDNYHVIARTLATPHYYYYRRRVDSLAWDSGFQRIDADIAGDHVFPVVWNRRLLLLWAVFERKQQASDVKLPKEGEKVASKAPYWDIKLAWIEFKEEKWTAKQLSKDALVAHGLDEDALTPKYQGRQKLTFRTSVDNKSNTLQVLCFGPLVSQLAPGMITVNTSIVGLFQFDGVNSMPSVQYFDFYNLFKINEKVLIAPKGTRSTNMAWTAEETNSTLRVTASEFKPGTTRNDLERQYRDILLLSSTDRKPSKLIVAAQDEQFSSQRPFFFQNSFKTYFIEPHRAPLVVVRPDMPSPFLTDGGIVGHIIDKLNPLIPYLNLPYPSPELIGGIQFPISGPLSGSIISTVSQPAGAVLQERTSGLLSAAAFETVIPSDTVDVSAKYRASLDIEATNILPVTSKLYEPIQYKFSLFYHPFVKEFLSNLNRDGVDGLLQRSVQFLGEDKDTFFNRFDPNIFAVMKDSRRKYAEDVVDFEDGSYSNYNWELFFHIPLMIADRLSKNQRFSDAQKWFHYIFDPTDTSTDFPRPGRYWRTKKLAATQSEQYEFESVPMLFQYLTKQKSGEQLDPKVKEMLRAFEDSVQQWRKNPFNPFLLARTRTTAFQKDVVMRYLDNLIAWGDYLFRQDTMESINEATQLYILASDILGRRPEEIPPRAVPGVATYNSLEPNLDSLSNALVQIEEMIPPQSANWVIGPLKKKQAVRPSTLYFCVPRNDKLLSYWDTVADRLFKIRNCMNLQGIVRQLALFEPKINPMLLVKAAASGMDLASALSDLNAPLPHYRFRVWLQRAVDITNELKSLGSALLSAIEKKDAEALALLRSQHEQAVNDAMKAIKKKQTDEAAKSLESVKRSKATVNERYQHYSNIDFMNAWEKTSMTLESATLAGLIIESAALVASGAAFVFPDAKIGAPTSIGVTFGGGNIGKAAEVFAAFMNRNAGLIRQSSSMAVTLGSYARRMDDWQLQARVAAKEMAQIDQQIAAAEVRLTMTEEEERMHELQIKNTNEMDNFMRRQKFSNRDLYDWMQGELTNLYFQYYNMAYDAAKRAERAYCYELGLQQANFVKFGYWDGLKKGLLAGEKLTLDLKAMEMAYLDEHRREYEITANISLAQLDPLSLIQLRENQEAFFALPEAIYDMNYPGHYMRRIKSVSLTIPCIVGPYTPVSCTLSLLKASVRTANTASGDKYSRQENDIRFSDGFGQFESMVTSTAQNDSGLFYLNFDDERYLPFEGAGAISSWRIQLNKDFRQFDYSTISDVILHVRYTSREGGDILRNLASTELKTKTLKAIAMAEGQNGLARLLSLRAEFPSQWYTLWNPAMPDTDKQETTLDLSAARFPFVFRQAAIQILKIQVFVFIAKEFLPTHNAATLVLSLNEGTRPPSTPAPAPLALAPYSTKPGNRVFRASKAFGRPAGVWRLAAALQGGGMVDRRAVEDVVFVCHYEVGGL